MMTVVAVGTSVVVLLRAEKPRRAVRARVEQARGVLSRFRWRGRLAPHITLPISRTSRDAKDMTARARQKAAQMRRLVGERARQLTGVGT